MTAIRPEQGPRKHVKSRVAIKSLLDRYPVRTKVKKALKLVTSNSELLDDNPILKNTLKVRNAYLDPLSLIQILLMKKLSDKDIAEEERTALLLTVNGLAAGLRNTG